MNEAAPSDDDDLTAAELALGLLDGAPRADALRRTLADRGFAAAVDGWRLRFAPLLDGIAEVTPPARMLAAIEARIADAPALPMRRWRAAAIAAMAIAAGLALALVTRAPPPVPARVAGENLVAQVAGKGGEPLFVARYDPAAAVLRVRTSNLPATAKRPELWVIGSDATPRSLGLLALNGVSDVAPGRLADALAAGATVALTLEPADGAPHAAPTGAILGSAKLAAI